jgi:hypothetical protein
MPGIGRSRSSATSPSSIRVPASTAFVLPDRRQPRIGTKRVGYVDYVFAEDRMDVRVVEPPELANHDLDDFPAAYDP